MQLAEKDFLNCSYKYTQDHEYNEEKKEIKIIKDSEKSFDNIQHPSMVLKKNSIQ